MKSPGGFTLVELLAVICILALIASLGTPAIQKMRDKAESTACLSNLRQIGTAVWLWIPDNGNRFPRIENDPANPVYEPDDGAKTLWETLSPYGLTTNTLRCPSEIKAGGKYFKQFTNSYECPPWAGDEAAASGQIQIYRQGGTFNIPASRVTLAWDYENVHSGGFNRLRADNTVSYMSLKPKYK
ncbi:prepilin-type N-terminal cleavage/methylation domain-containing protein [bacterium]|nr:prepilin-type N-terminal cleavage/methylation domain-containing protein [bacterium]